MKQQGTTETKQQLLAKEVFIPQKRQRLEEKNKYHYKIMENGQLI